MFNCNSHVNKVIFCLIIIIIIIIHSEHIVLSIFTCFCSLILWITFSVFISQLVVLHLQTASAASNVLNGDRTLSRRHLQNVARLIKKSAGLLAEPAQPLQNWPAQSQLP